ncbi:hypothetical protein [Lewinella sp. IMCC34191]|uniref:hypothetical protein n=1 Tax=Lewinella sp. IMCC34191 TaxID=2259172 RepID=UPI000E286763|nr:hypothetical protein [Lewinella sp. IMCC34191]
MAWRYLIVFLLLPLQHFAQQSTNRTVNARAELARKEIVLGDQIFLTVNVSAPPGTEVFPISPEQIAEAEGLEVIQAEQLRVVAENPERLLEQRFTITSFDTGYVSVPPLAVFFEGANGVRDTTFTTDLRLTVRGAVVSDEEDIMPIKPIIEEPRNLLDYWWVFAILAVVAIFFGVREYRCRQTREAPPPPPPPPPHEVALGQLDVLEGERLWQSGQTDAYYVRLTRILRTYLEARFGIPALEMTTRQIVTALDTRQGLNREQRSELSELLQLSDLVKFAKATPAEDLHPQGLQRVREFVVETKPTPAPDNQEVNETSTYKEPS